MDVLEAILVEMTPLGYPEAPSRVAPRKGLAEIIFHEKFGG